MVIKTSKNFSFSLNDKIIFGNKVANRFSQISWQRNYSNYSIFSFYKENQCAEFKKRKVLTNHIDSEVNSNFVAGNELANVLNNNFSNKTFTELSVKRTGPFHSKLAGDKSIQVSNQSYSNNQQILDQNIVKKFINFLTKRGNKAKAKSIFLKAIYLLNKRSMVASKDLDSKVGIIIQPSSLQLFNSALQNVIPIIDVKKIRVAGTTHQVPAILNQSRQYNLGINWLIRNAIDNKGKNSSRNKHSLEDSLVSVWEEASLKQGQARNKRNDLHKLADANRAFAHFRWW